MHAKGTVEKNNLYLLSEGSENGKGNGDIKEMDRKSRSVLKRVNS